MLKISLAHYNFKTKSDIFIQCYSKKKAPSIHIDHVDTVYANFLIKDVAYLYLIWIKLKAYC